MSQSDLFPFPSKSRQSSLARKQFLHGPLLDLPLLGDTLLKGLNEGVGIGESSGDGYLFRTMWR